jgi:very-short-patch-repair endonuclease
MAARAGRLLGVKFRRQKVIGRFIADFAANDPKLVVELDGDSHVLREEQDAARTQLIEEQGYKVVRFTNLEVMENLDGVLSSLAASIEALRPAPPPTPPLKVRGLEGDAAAQPCVLHRLSHAMSSA